MSLADSFKPEHVYTGQQIIDFLNEAEAQYADKISMIEAQRHVAMSDAVSLRIELGKALRGAAKLEQNLADSEAAREQAVEECERLNAFLAGEDPAECPCCDTDETTGLEGAVGDGVAGD